MKFALGGFLLTRALVVAAFFIAVPHGTLHAFANWDGGWYASIVHHGYAFAHDGRQHNVAFFPMFPLLAAALGRVGIAWPLSGALVNNLAFLAATLLLYQYSRARLGERAAKWTVLLACALPPSLFCTVAYSEGLFIFFSVLSLAWYKRGFYLGAGLAAAAAAATRPFGIALALAVLAAALVERRRTRDVLACAIGVVGALLFPLFLALHFHDALAFIHAQSGWRHGVGIDSAGWTGVVRGAFAGRSQDWIGIALVAVGFPALVVFRKRFGAADMLFTVLCAAMILFAGTPLSLERLLYAIVPLLMAIGELFRRAPWLGYSAIPVSLVLLVLDSATFAHFKWVA